MKAFFQRISQDIPADFFRALLLAAGFMAFVTWDQSHWWHTKEDYSFGWLVPAFVAFVFYDRLPRIKAALAACVAPASPRAVGSARILLNIAVGLCLTAGALLFLLGAFYRAGAGSSYPGTLAISLGAAAIILPLLFLNTPATPSPAAAPFWRDERVKLTALFVFPCLVWLVSAPMVSVVENNLSHFLLQRVVESVFTIFELLGLPIEKQGNVLVLPLGQVGVEEACSGIRSLTACLFAGSFLGAVFLAKTWKKIALFVCAMLFAFFTNILRSLFLTAWAFNYGPEAIEGTVHDTAGYAVLGLTVIGLLCMIPLFNMKFGTEDPAELPPDEPSAS